MSLTIKDIAELAQVSTATVSHVINKTRYVSPELEARVRKVIADTGYDAKINLSPNKLRMGKLSEIAFVVPNLESAVYSKLASELESIFEDEGYFFPIYTTNNDKNLEKHIISSLLANKRIAGIVLVPAGENAKDYTKLINSGVPFVCVERTINGAAADSVLSENEQALYRGTSHLIKNGHERIGLFIEGRELSTATERLNGYKKALAEFGLVYDEALVFRTVDEVELVPEQFESFDKNTFPTAFVAGTNFHTLMLLKALDEHGLEYPKDVSVVGFSDDIWCEVVNPPLTSLTQDTIKMAQEASRLLLAKLGGANTGGEIVRLPVDLTIRKSTICIERGPMGEMAISPEELMLSDEEIDCLKHKEYKVGISFHYGGTEWTRLHERAIRDTLGKFGIKVVAVTEAHFDPELQITQLEGLRMQNLDAIISMPADEIKTAQKYKELSEETKIILIGNIPMGFVSDEYCAVVSVNERENGQNAGKILGDFFYGRTRARVGLITHGAPFFTTRQRDYAAEQVLMENFHNVEIVSQANFHRISNAYNVCVDMITQHPEIEGLYVSWERPALEVIRALKDIGRSDIALTTVDLDYEIASYLAAGDIVKGLSAQRPYEQGEAAALAVANALLGKTDFRYIGVRPSIVLRKNLKKSWKDIMHTVEPDFLKE